MPWLKIVYYSALVLAFVGSLTVYKNRKYVLFIPLIALSLGVEIAREFIPHKSPIESSILLLLVIVEYSLLSLIISNFLRSQVKRKIILFSIFIMIPVFIILQLTLIDKSESYRYLNHMIQSPFLCAWTILYLFETARHDEEFEVTNNPMFWISLGNLLFYSASFFSYAFGSYMVAKDKGPLGEAIFVIAQILNILLYILYFIGFLCLKTKRSYYSQQ